MILECIGLVTWGCNVKMCVGLCSFVAAALFLFFYFALDMYLIGTADIQVLIASWKRSWRMRRKKRSNQMVPPKETIDLLNVRCSVCSFLVQVVVGKFL